MSSKTTIIVVENGRKFSDLLRGHGHIVLSARDGDGALGLLATETPGLLVLDMETAQLDTIEVCRRARAIIGDEVPIFLLAPADNPGNLHEALQSGATDYLLKVENPENIIQRLEQIVFVAPEQRETDAAAEEDARQVREHARAMRAADGTTPEATPETTPETDSQPGSMPTGTPKGARSGSGTSTGGTPAALAAARKAGKARGRPPNRLVAAKWAAIVLGSIWLAGSGYNEFLRADPSARIRAIQLKRQIDNCAGTFKTRYVCKSAALIRSENRLFGRWTKKIGIVFIPILMLLVLYHSVFMRMWGAQPARRGAARKRPARPQRLSTGS